MAGKKRPDEPTIGHSSTTAPGGEKALPGAKPPRDPKDGGAGKKPRPAGGKRRP